jgi:hypothetical protein
LQANQKDRHGRCGRQADTCVGIVAKHRGQFVMDDLDYHLARRDGPQDLSAQGGRLYLGNKITDDRQCDIGF